MPTKLGLHITPGSRNGYGPVVAEAPAVVIAIGEHGALLEAWEKSDQRTITIYRDSTVFEHGNAPPNFPHISEEEARRAADRYWPALRAAYIKHPADFYQPTNEIGGGHIDSLPSYINLIAFETRLMELAEADPEAGKLKLAVGSHAGGSPPWNMWVEYLVPFIARAGQGGHIYSRHAYGPGLLTQSGPMPTDGNAGRPFKEAAELRRRGIRTPMVITEAGQNAGFQFPGTGSFMEDVIRYDQLCQQHDNIWGFCCWTYGNWRDGKPNIQDASDAMANYLREVGGAVRPAYPSTAAAPVVVLAPVDAGNGDGPGAIQPEPVPVSGKTAVGIHATADGGIGVGWEQPVRSEYRALQPEVLKFMSNQDPGMIGTIVADNRQTVRTIIVRAFLDWGSRSINPEQFVEYTLSDVTRTVAKLREVGVDASNIIIELHNEPNLRQEGLDHSWQNGRECMAFFSEVLDRYEASLPHVQYGMGGLSPGGGFNQNGQRARTDSKVFLSEMKSHPRWSAFDVHLVHLYTSDNWHNSIWWVDHCQGQTPGMPVWITESSWHTADGTTGAAYAAKLVELVRLLDQRPTKGITFYCMSASNPRYYHEVWCRSADKNTPFSNVASRGIAQEVRRLRPLAVPVPA